MRLQAVGHGEGPEQRSPLAFAKVKAHVRTPPILSPAYLTLNEFDFVKNPPLW